MTVTRQFHVVLGGRESRTRKIRNGVPQASAIALTLSNVYISDTCIPKSQSYELDYADDCVLAYKSKCWNEIESVLSQDTTSLNQYFDMWYLKMNTTKTVSSAFHLNNHQSAKTLNIKVNGNTLPEDRNPNTSV